MKIKKIRTFKEYLTERKNHPKVNEDVKIEVDWWEVCIVEVLDILKDECNGNLSDEALCRYIKNKFAILGREWDEYSDNIYIMHIKDLIWQLHGDSFCVDGNNGENAVIHTKGVAIEELAQEIWQKVQKKMGSDVGSNTPITRLVDKDSPASTSADDFDDCFDDLPFEHKKVKKYREYLKEAYATKVKDGESDACLKYCLERIEKEAGSLDPDAVFDAAVKYADGRAKSRMVAMYVRPMVEDFLKNSNVLICNLAETDDEQMQEMVIDDAIQTLLNNVTDDVLYALYKVNGGKDVEVE